MYEFPGHQFPKLTLLVYLQHWCEGVIGVLNCKLIQYKCINESVNEYNTRQFLFSVIGMLMVLHGVGNHWVFFFCSWCFLSFLSNLRMGHCLKSDLSIQMFGCFFKFAFSRWYLALFNLTRASIGRKSFSQNLTNVYVFLEKWPVAE